jgi:hypothetical protein
MSLDILEIERRILRACRTIRALPDKDRKLFAVPPTPWDARRCRPNLQIPADRDGPAPTASAECGCINSTATV